MLSVAFLAVRVPLVASTGRLIFDEKYYVNAARTLLGRELPRESPYFGQAPGTDPNLEHPPLGKLAIAGGIAVLGDRPAGWRAASLLMGSLAVLALFWMVRAAGGGEWVALGAAALLAADNLFMVHASIATLDILVLPPMMAAVALYLRGRILPAGISAGVAACIKLVGLQAVMVAVLIEGLALLGTGAWRKRSELFAGLKKAGLIAGAAAGVYLGGLFILDAAFTDLPRHPLAHSRYMLRYATNAPEAPGPQPGPALAPPSKPLEWMANRKAINYERREVSGPDGPRVVLAFEGKMNPFVIFAAVPALAVAFAAWRQRGNAGGLLASAWFAGTFLAFMAIAAGHHYNYLYYMLVVLPGICVAIAVALSGRGLLRRSARVAYATAVAAAMLAHYPVRIPGLA